MQLTWGFMQVGLDLVYADEQLSDFALNFMNIV